MRISLFTAKRHAVKQLCIIILNPKNFFQWLNLIMTFLQNQSSNPKQLACDEVLLPADVLTCGMLQTIKDRALVMVLWDSATRESY